MCGGGSAHARVFLWSIGSLLCLACETLTNPIQPGAAVICCLLLVFAVQEPHLHRESWLGGFDLLMAVAFHLPGFSLESRLPPADN